MNWLLDTHLAVFCLTDPDELTRAEKAVIQNPSGRVMVSLVSVWEIAVKHGLSRGHRRPFKLTAQTAFQAFEAAGFEVLPITAAHVCKLEDLPPLHGDPFDRLLIAQAVCEDFGLLSRDWLIRRYFE